MHQQRPSIQKWTKTLVALQMMVLAALFCGCEKENLPCEENLSVVQARHVGEYTFQTRWREFSCMYDCDQERIFNGTITCLQNPEKVIIEYMSGYREECYIWVDSTVHAIHDHTGNAYNVGRFYGDSVILYIHIGGLGGSTMFVKGGRR
jgi:hypothetical protein